MVMEGSKSEQLGEVTQAKVLRGSGDPSSISKILGFGSPDLYFHSQFHRERGTGLMPWERSLRITNSSLSFERAGNTRPIKHRLDNSTAYVIQEKPSLAFFPNILSVESRSLLGH